MPLILGTNSIKDTGFNVANSLRFNDGSSDYLTRTPSGNGNRKVFTISLWVKRANLGIQTNMIGSSDTSFGNGLFLEFKSDDTLRFGFQDPNVFKVTNRKFRDVASWYSIIVAVDVTQSSNSDRVKIYVNGVQETSFSTDDTMANEDRDWNNTQAHSIGRSGTYNGLYFDGYLAEVVNVDGQQLTPTSFGEFDEDSGIWKPIDVSGLTFGTNGFYLDFENSGSLGADVSGNGNNFTVNNLTAIDQSASTCTNNEATLNPLDGHISHVVFSEGNLKSDFGSTASKKSFVRSTIGVASGKWYFEAKVIQNANFFVIGISDRPSPSDTTELGYGAYDYAYANDGGSFSKGNNGTFSSYGDSYTTNDIIGVAVDLDNNKIYFSKNGTWQNSGNPTNGTNPAFTITAPSSTDHGFYFFCVGDMTAANNVIWSANFGSPSYAISSGNTDGNGYGNMEYEIPSGYYVLNSKNLAEYG